MIYGLLARMAAGVALCIAAASGASAQNYDGNGLIRFGVFAGGEFYDVKVPNSSFGSASLDGAMIGFSAGYDMVFDRRFVLGVEADLQVGDTTGRVAGFKAHADYMATLRARVGILVTPQLLVYGTGGGAWSGVGLESTFDTLSGQVDSNRTSPGWIAGGGLEYDMKDYFGTILFGEYLVGGFNAWTNAPGVGGSVDSEVQTFRLGVKFKVGHDYRDEWRGGGREPLK